MRARAGIMMRGRGSREDRAAAPGGGMRAMMACAAPRAVARAAGTHNSTGAKGQRNVEEEVNIQRVPDGCQSCTLSKFFALCSVAATSGGSCHQFSGGMIKYSAH